MKNLLTFDQFLNEARSPQIEFTEEQYNLFKEIGSATDEMVKELNTIVKKNKAKTVSTGRGGLNVIDSKKDILFDVFIIPNDFEKKIKIFRGVSSNITSTREIQDGLPFNGRNGAIESLRKQYRALDELIKDFDSLQMNERFMSTLTPSAVKEYHLFIKDCLNGIERNFEFLSNGNYIK